KGGRRSADVREVALSDEQIRKAVADALARHPISTRKESTTMSPMQEVVAKSRAMQGSLMDAIERYAREHGVSKSVAADMVLLSPVVNENVRLDKSLRAATDRDYGLALECRRDHGVRVIDAGPVRKGDKGKYGRKLAEMVGEFHDSPYGKDMTYQQAFDHIATKTSA